MCPPIRGAGGQLATLNCGYGHAFSVIEVIDTVKRVARADFPVDRAGPRPGDPAQIVARGRTTRELL